MAQIEVQPYKRITRQNKKKVQQNLFSRIEINDIFPAVVSFLLARVVVLGTISPFGLAFFAAAFLRSKMWIPLICVTLGAWSAGLGFASFKYTLAMLLFISYKFLVDKDDKLTPLVGCFMTSAVLFASGMLFMAFDMVLLYDTIMLFLESLVCGFMVMVFSEVVPLMDRNAIRSYLTNEQILSLAVTAAIILSGMADISRVGYVSICEILCVTIILIVAYFSGPGLGACVGVAAGLVCGIHTPDILPVLGIYAFYGFVAGCMRPLGKFGVGVGFLIAGVIMSLYTVSFTMGFTNIFSLAAGTALFLSIPKKAYSYIGGAISVIGTGETGKPYVARVQDALTRRLRSVSESFLQLASVFDELSVRRAKAYQVDMAHLFDDAADRVCKSCGLCLLCWEKEFNKTYQALFKLADKLEQKGYGDILDLPEHFKKRCIRIDELLSTVNHLFEIYRLNSMWSAQIDESRKLISQQYLGVANIINTIAGEVNTNFSFANKAEAKIKSALLKKRIKPKQVCVYETPSGRTEVEVIFFKQEDLEYEGEVLLAVSGVLAQPMRVVDIPLKEGEYRLMFEPQYNFSITSGIARLKKQGQSKSGDSYLAMGLSDNRYVLAISDGMGSGRQAAAESGVTISLLEQLLNAGFDRAATVKLINSALVLKSGTESFATIDLALIDLMRGTAEFVKIGSAASYIKRNSGKMDTIYCTSMPAGILTAVDMELSSKRLFDGDIIVLVSDGVAGERLGSNWLADLLAGIDSDDPDEIAELILKEAVILKKGNVDDDMTVLAARVWEKD